MPDESFRKRALTVDWWFRDRTGRLILGQLPNPALWVWLVSVIVRWAGWLSSHEHDLLWAGRGALVVWALDELVRGVSPFRRVLGAVVLAVQLASFA